VLNESALIRTQYCDIYMEYIDRKKWESVMKFSMFSRGRYSYRIPNFSPYFITVKNAYNKPLKITGIHLIVKDKLYQRLNSDELNAEFSSEQYKNFNFTGLNTSRRMLPVSIEADVTVPSLNKINFDKDTITFLPDYIPPEDIIVFFAFFSPTPASDDKYKVKIELDTGVFKKVIDFDFVKSEYRTEGKYFRNKGKINENRQTDY
jgi:hypothetical protein